MTWWQALMRGVASINPFPTPVERPDLPGIESDREAIASHWRAVRRDLCKAINRELARKEHE